MSTSRTRRRGPGSRRRRASSALSPTVRGLGTRAHGPCPVASVCAGDQSPLSSRRAISSHPEGFTSGFFTTPDSPLRSSGTQEVVHTLNQTDSVQHRLTDTGAPGGPGSHMTFDLRGGCDGSRSPSPAGRGLQRGRGRAAALPHPTPAAARSGGLAPTVCQTTDSCFFPASRGFEGHPSKRTRNSELHVAELQALWPLGFRTGLLSPAPASRRKPGLRTPAHPPPRPQEWDRCFKDTGGWSPGRRCSVAFDLCLGHPLQLRGQAPPARTLRPSLKETTGVWMRGQVRASLQGLAGGGSWKGRSAEFPASPRDEPTPPRPLRGLRVPRPGSPGRWDVPT